MKSSIQRWGNRLALRVPKAVADELSVGEGDPVDLKVATGKPVVAPYRVRNFRVEDLVAKITPVNRMASKAAQTHFNHSGRSFPFLKSAKTVNPFM